MNKELRSYFARIGKKGGSRSRRVLSPEAARKMAYVREAKRAYKKYYSQCFWSFDPKLKITEDDLKWVGQELLKSGGMGVWKLGRKLCR